MEKPRYIAIIDAGHGEVFGRVYDLTTGKAKTVGIPAMRARMTGDTLGVGKEQEHIVQWVEWYGRKYAVGFDALTIRRENLERHTGETRYGGEFHLNMIAAALARAGVKDGPVDLTVFMPPKYYKTGGERVKKLIIDSRVAHKSDDGSEVPGSNVEIRLMGDKKVRAWDYSNVTVLPEGLSAGLLLSLDETGKPVKNNVLDSAVILDLGMKTCDAIEVTGGKFNPDNLQYSTFDNEGLRAQLFQPLLEDVQGMSPDYAGMTVDDIDMYVRESLGNGGTVIADFAGIKTDITENYNYWRGVYAGHIANNVISEHYQELKGYRHAIMHGGGYGLAYPLFREWYGEKIFDPSKFPHLKKVQPIAWNAEGGLRAALARARKNGWIE